MKILLGTVKSGLSGGIEVGTFAINEKLKNTKDCDVAVFRYGKCSAKEHIFQKIIRSLIDLILFIWFCKKERPDLVHLNSAFNKHGTLRDFFFLATAKFCNIPVFLCFHGSDAKQIHSSFFLNLLGKSIFRNSNLIGLLSTQEREIISQYFNIKDKSVIVKYGIDIKKSWNSFVSNNMNNLPEGYRILFISRFIKEKGPLDLISAFKYIYKKNKKINLILVGDGSVKKHCELMAKELGLQDRVVFVGRVSEAEAREYYIQTDMMILPTYHVEGFPLTIIQSLAAGLPIITTPIRGAADYLREPENCLWTEPKNPEMLAEKITYLIEHKEVREKMSINNRKLAKQFDAEKVTGEYLGFYKQILSDKK